MEIRKKDREGERENSDRSIDKSVWVQSPHHTQWNMCADIQIYKLYIQNIYNANNGHT